MKTRKAYGEWDSVIPAELLASKSDKLGHIKVIHEQIYWLETRAKDKGRGVIVTHKNGENLDVTPEGYSVRSKAHEYGGGDFWGHYPLIIFADDKDGSLYSQNLESNQIKKISETPDFAHQYRYVDGDLCCDNILNICVEEVHIENGTAHDVTNQLVLFNLNNNEKQIIAEGYDFYSNPRFSPCATKISWLCWNHPNMPWDESEVWVADNDKGIISNPRKVAGGKTEGGMSVSCFNPQWSNQGELFYVADNNGWWHIYSERNTYTPVHYFEKIEFGLPQWQFGWNSFVIANSGDIFAVGTKDAKQGLYKITTDTLQIDEIEESWCSFSVGIELDNENLYMVANCGDIQPSLFRIGIESHHLSPINYRAPIISIENISKAQHISFPTSNDMEAYGFFYPPQNTQFYSEQELPPLIVMSHGGPTGMANSGFDLQIQFWTNRGFAVADVNYRGSTGYGRKYRDSLKGNWGIYDVDDCIAMAEYLAKKGLVDRERCAIRGGSAGGYTTLCALTFHDKFKVGMSRYGVADLLSLAEDSHKFEIRYLDSVVGPLPESKQIYLDRSPSEHTDKLSCPILILQGLDDKVVPPSQAEAMVKALEANKLPYQYMAFQGEGHGFRKPATIIQAFEAELAFYQEHLL